MKRDRALLRERSRTQVGRSALIFRRWPTQEQFEKQDFGDWSETWTVGEKAANPVIVVSVTGSCLPGGQRLLSGSGPNVALFCDTATGHQSFVTPSTGDSSRTPDGRVIPARARLR
jgi:hypothetical protein